MMSMTSHVRPKRSLGSIPKVWKLLPLRPDPDADVESAIRDHVHGRDVLGQPQRIVEQQPQIAAGCPANPLGASGNLRQHGERRRVSGAEAEVVLSEVDPVVADYLREHRIFDEVALGVIR